MGQHVGARGPSPTVEQGWGGGIRRGGGGGRDTGSVRRAQDTSNATETKGRGGSKKEKELENYFSKKPRKPDEDIETQVFKHRRHEGAPAQLVVPCETTHDGAAVVSRQWGAAKLH
jgi:hypothetical protein